MTNFAFSSNTRMHAHEEAHSVPEGTVRQKQVNVFQTLLKESPMHKKGNLLKFFLAMFAIWAFAGAAQAGTTGSEFEALHTLLTGWANGYLGKALAVAGFLFGAGYGVAKQTIVPAILGIVFAIVFAIGPGVIEGMLTAVI